VEGHNSVSWWMLVICSHSKEVGGVRVEHLYHNVSPSFAFPVLSFWGDAFRFLFFCFQNGGVICICMASEKEDN